MRNPRNLRIHASSPLAPPGGGAFPALGLALILGFCGSDPELVPPTTPTLAPLAERDRLYADNSGGIQDSLDLVIRAAEEWTDVWSRATSMRSSPPPRPEIDFSRHMVILVAAGRRGPEGRIRVDSVGPHDQLTPDGDVEKVFKVKVRTVEGCAGFEADVYPIEIVRVPIFDGPVIFERRTVRSPDCGRLAKGIAGSSDLRRTPARQGIPPPGRWPPF